MSYDDYRQSPHYDPSISYDEDNGTMPENVAALSEVVVGHRIVSAERRDVATKSLYGWETGAFVITLDNGKRVVMWDSDDCCAHTALEEFLLHADKVDHVITGVRSENGYTKWHVFADFGDVLELTVSWSAGNPFYYGYGFEITVQDIESELSQG